MMVSVSKVCPVCSWRGLLKNKNTKSSVTLQSFLQLTSQYSVPFRLPYHPLPLWNHGSCAQLYCVYSTYQLLHLQALFQKLGTFLLIIQTSYSFVSLLRVPPSFLQAFTKCLPLSGLSLSVTLPILCQPRTSNSAGVPSSSKAEIKSLSPGHAHRTHH